MDKGYVMSMDITFIHLEITFIHLGAIGRGALNVLTIETQIGAVWLLNY